MDNFKCIQHVNFDHNPKCKEQCQSCKDLYIKRTWLDDEDGTGNNDTN